MRQVAFLHSLVHGILLLSLDFWSSGRLNDIGCLKKTILFQNNKSVTAVRSSYFNVLHRGFLFKVEPTLLCSEINPT